MATGMERNTASPVRSTTVGRLVSLPEFPSEADASKIWSALTLVMTRKNVWVNQSECAWSLGLPGAPIPRYQSVIAVELAWKSGAGWGVKYSVESPQVFRDV